MKLTSYLPNAPYYRKRKSGLLQKFYNLSLYKKQLFSLCLSKVICLLVMTTLGIFLAIRHDSILISLSQQLSLTMAIYFFALVLDAWLAILLAKTIVRPIEFLQKTTHQFASGNLQARAEILAADEVGELAHNFNLMADRIIALFEEAQLGIEEQKRLNQQLQQEIQERQEVEKALRTSQQLQQTLLDHLPQGIFWQDQNSVYLGCNQSFANIVGVADTEAILGKSVEDLAWEFEMKQKLRSQDLEVMHTVAPSYQIIQAQSPTTNQPIWLEIHKVPLTCPQGDIIGILGSCEDISERKQVEDQIRQLNRNLAQYAQELETSNQTLQQTQEFVNQVIDTIPDPIFVKNKAHQFLLLNNSACDFLGVTREEILGKSDQELLSNADAQLCWDMEERVLATHQVEQQEKYLTDIRGRCRFISTKKTCFVDAFGEPYLLVAIRDLTHHKRTEERLAQLNECFLKFGSNPEANITNLVMLCDKLLGAVGVLYHQRAGDLIHSFGTCQHSLEQLSSQISSQSSFLDTEEHQALIIDDQLYTYLNITVKCDQRVTGSLSVLYHYDATIKAEDYQLISLIASAIGVEETRQQFQKKLHQSRERFALAVEGVQDGIWDWDLQSCQIYFSPRWKNILGYEDQDLPNVLKSWVQNIHPDDLRRVLAMHHSYLEGKSSSYEVEFRALHKDGTYRWILARGAALWDTMTGKPYRLAGSHTDITERKRVEESLEKRDRYLTILVELQHQLLATSLEQNLYQLTIELLGSVVDASRIYIFENHRDSQGNLFMSQKAEWCSEGIVPEINNPTLQNLSYEDTFPRWQKILTQGKFVHGIVADFPESERKILEPQGISTILILPLIVQGNFFGFIGFDNCTHAQLWEPVEVNLLSSAATAISLAQERQLSQQQVKLQLSVLEAATDGIALVNAVGEYVYLNHTHLQLFGYSDPHELVGKSWKNIYDFQEVQRLQKIISSELVKTGQWRGEATAKRKDGSTFTEEFSLTLLPDGGLIRVCRDISERKLAEAQLKTNLKEKEVLLKEIHHRVKNNLYVISSLLNLQSAYVAQEDILNLFADSQNRIQAMALIHEQLYQSQDLAQINFADYIKRLVNNLFISYNASSRGIKSSLNIEPVALNLETAIPCGLLINELVTNSFKHAFPNASSGHIYIDLKLSNQGKLNLVVSDDGIGLAEDLDWKNSSSLGLRLVRILTQQIDATIEQQKIPSGTAFQVTFSELKYKDRI